ncbi:PREDICTED: apoptotic chromatin condensation inducer in the nucleus-like [Nanorana parkeri]|uniref:apoptotic chromatin condensation inducer in the nucleus-like n=1 Tax=Nanorana parkeri TaxID=125878 RepID=UPI0008548AB0|nr:PREDICTED: apoptotic chromatin condensation inducer in the nucleus-like [Nanorana parkeri]
MAELEDVTLDGRPLDSLRVTDLRAALEERGLAKSGAKNTLMKRLKGALMLENLQKQSTHTGFQPNSQMGEEMGQNSFIKQYLEKQQELLRQRLQKEAREAQETEEPLAESEEENTNPDIMPEPPDLLCSVLKVPDVDLGKRTQKKSVSVLEDPDDSEEEIPKKRERRSSRVKQAKTSKPPVLTQPGQEQEPRRSSTRVRRSKGDIAKEEVEDVGEEEEEEMEEKELPVEKDEEEPPKRRRSSRSATIHQTKSPKVKRSPSPPELSETVSKSTSADSEEMAEERVPPLLSLERFQHQMSEKQMTTATEKAVSPQFLHKESSKSHRSPQKWGRHVRERNESSSDPSLQQPPAATCVIQQAPNLREEGEKAKPKILDSHMAEESGSITRGAATKDVKVKSSLVLMKPQVRSKSEGKAYVSEQSLHIVEKSSSRGVQAMSILEKQKPESYENKESTITLSSCPEVGRSNVKTMSILEKVNKDKLDANPAVRGGDSFEPEKAEVVSPVYGTGLSKTRKLRIRSSSANRNQLDPNSLQTVTCPDVKEIHETEELSVSLNVEQTAVLAVTMLNKPDLKPCGPMQTREEATDLLSKQVKESLSTAKTEKEPTEKSDLDVSCLSVPDIMGGITSSTDHSLGEKVSYSGSLELQQKESMHVNEISEIKQAEDQLSAQDFNMSENTVLLGESKKFGKPDKVTSKMVLEEIQLKPFVPLGQAQQNILIQLLK